MTQILRNLGSCPKPPIRLSPFSPPQSSSSGLARHLANRRANHRRNRPAGQTARRPATDTPGRRGRVSTNRPATQPPIHRGIL